MNGTGLYTSYIDICRVGQHMSGAGQHMSGAGQHVGPRRPPLTREQQHVLPLDAPHALAHERVLILDLGETRS
jgi:hypothetical protein